MRRRTGWILRVAMTLIALLGLAPAQAAPLAATTPYVRLQHIGSFGKNTGALAVSGTSAYIGDNVNGTIQMSVLNVSNPALPARVGRFVLPEFPVDFELAGSLLYIADGINGLYIVDVSSPSNPVQRGHLDTASPLQAVRVVGSTAYLATGYGGLQLVNVANPAAPAQISSLTLNNREVRDVDVSGSYAYLATASTSSGGELVIVNAANQAAPQIAGRLATPSYDMRRLQIAATTVYVANDLGGLAIISVANPAAPVLRSRLPAAGIANEAGNALALQVLGSSVYLGSSITTLQVIAAANPSQPYLRGAGQELSDVYALQVSPDGTLIYVANGAFGLAIYRVTPEYRAYIALALR